MGGMNVAGAPGCSRRRVMWRVSPRLARYQPHLNERLRGHFERCPQIDGALTDLVVVSLRRDTGRALQSMGAPRECGVVAVDA